MRHMILILFIYMILKVLFQGTATKTQTIVTTNIIQFKKTAALWKTESQKSVIKKEVTWQF